MDDMFCSVLENRKIIKKSLQCIKFKKFLCIDQYGVTHSGHLNTMSGVRSLIVCNGRVFVLGKINPLNRFQYLEGLVFTVVHGEYLGLSQISVLCIARNYL